MREGRGFIAGVLTTVLAMSLVVGAQASVGKKTMTADYNNIKIELDGQQITPTDANGKAVEPFAVDGTTYLPVRAVSEALDVNVEWDGSTSTVKLSRYFPYLNEDSIQVMDTYKSLEDRIEYGQFILNSSFGMMAYVWSSEPGEIMDVLNKALYEQIPSYIEQLDIISDNVAYMEYNMTDVNSKAEINVFVKPLLESSYTAAEKMETAIYAMRNYVYNPTMETLNELEKANTDAFNSLSECESSAFSGYQRMYSKILING